MAAPAVERAAAPDAARELGAEPEALPPLLAQELRRVEDQRVARDADLALLVLTEARERAAVVDLDASRIVAIEPHKQGDKVATWAWENGKVTVASVDGVTDELELRAGGNEMAGTGVGRRYNTTSQSGGGWAPWETPMAISAMVTS